MLGRHPQGCAYVGNGILIDRSSIDVAVEDSREVLVPQLWNCLRHPRTHLRVVGLEGQMRDTRGFHLYQLLNERALQCATKE